MTALVGERVKSKMTEEITNEIQETLTDAWHKFCRYYDRKVDEYSKELSEKDARESHWICWNEYDLMFHIGRLFYDILRKREEERFSNVGIHFEKNVNSSNFGDYDFGSRLTELKNRLEMKRGPKVDMIIANEAEDCRSFLLCAEVKYFHGPAYYGATPKEAIDNDIKKLKAIMDLKIANRATFMLFDDYYVHEDVEMSNIIRQNLTEINKGDTRIKVLSHSSEAKLGKYRRRI